MDFVSNPSRDAQAVIAGFVFQVNLTILRWLSLGPTEHLELECGEDIDLIREELSSSQVSPTRLLEQIKLRSASSLTLKSREALQSLAHFCEHRANNPNWCLQFRFMTTARLGWETGWREQASAIETWERVRSGYFAEDDRAKAIASICALLRECDRPGSVSELSWNHLRDVIFEKSTDELASIIQCFEWSLIQGDARDIERDICLILDQRKVTELTRSSATVYEHLFAFVFRRISSSGVKCLTVNELESELRASSVSIDEAKILGSIRSRLDQLSERVSVMESAFQQQAGEVNLLREAVEALSKRFGLEIGFALGAISVSTDLPDLVTPCAQRRDLVAAILDRVEKQRLVMLIGEPGSGKTQLLRLAANLTQRNVIWLNIPRASTEAHACFLIDSLVSLSSGAVPSASIQTWYASAATSFTNALIVIDDLPQAALGGPLLRRLNALYTSSMAVNAQLLVSSYFRLPISASAPFGDPYCEAPRFTISDIAELLRANSAPSSIASDSVVQLLRTVTEGLPILVAAAVHYLKDRAWKFTADDLESLLRGDFAAGLRSDAAGLLRATVVDPGERELLIRLSLAMGPFSIEDIARVARVPQAVALPSEKVARSSGLWLQPTGRDGYVRSPLITSNLAEFLDPQTRRGVHWVLAHNLLRRKVLGPLDVITCLNHLVSADDNNSACVVLIQALMSVISQDGELNDVLGLTTVLASFPIPDGVDPEVRLAVRAFQVVILAKLGRDYTHFADELGELIQKPSIQGWAVLLASTTVALHMALRSPALANQYVAIALEHSDADRLPDGSRITSGDTPLEMILWMTAYKCDSDEEMESWLTTIAQLGPEQRRTLEGLELMEDQITIFCDGVWRREYRKLDGERDWIKARENLHRVRKTAAAINFELLEAAAIRTEIVIVAEWQKNLEQAVVLANESMARFMREDSRFLISEVMGRQLLYGGQRFQARLWLNRSLGFNSYHRSLWRRNVLLTLAEIHSKSEPAKALDFAAQALKLSEDDTMGEPILIESLTEYAIALWNGGNRQAAFEALERAVKTVLDTKSESDGWKGLFVQLFGVVSFFSGVALNGHPQAGHVEPAQGLFLGSRDALKVAFRPAQIAFICMRMAMYGEGIQNVAAAGHWTQQALGRLDEFPEAWAGVGFSSWLGVCWSLLNNDFELLSRIAMWMSKPDIPSEELLRSLGVPEELIKNLQENSPANPTAGQRSTLLVIPVVSLCFRLAFLQLSGKPCEIVDDALAYFRVFSGETVSVEPFPDAFRTSLVLPTEWPELRQLGEDAMRRQEYVCGLIFFVGVICRSPVAYSLYFQTWLMRQCEGFFRTCPSLIKEILVPFFKELWRRAIRQSPFDFRTARTYTLQQVEATEPSIEGIRSMLRRMRFCLGVDLPHDAMDWLGGY